MSLAARNVSWTAGGRTILTDVTLEVVPGEFLGLIGPNGSGKTSLLSILSGIRKPRQGVVSVAGKPLPDFSRRDIARKIAFVEQQAETLERITARQAVELGRTPHLSALSPWSKKDHAITSRALDEVGMTDFTTRMWHTLSGGERQRLHIARALAQEPDILLLDEPTNHLDVKHQIALLELVSSQPLTVVAALHDLNHAAMFCDRIAVMDGGRLVGLGTPSEMLTSERLSQVFGVTASVETDETGASFVRYGRSRRHLSTASA